tara:strand:+ start:72 stop:1067 length:996 start_codon:yes stop_codon:yes gene_type:complete
MTEEAHQEIIQKLIFVKEHYGRKLASQTTMTNNAKMFIKLAKMAYKEKQSSQRLNYFYQDFRIVKSLLEDYSVSTQINYITIILQLLEYDKIKIIWNTTKSIELYKNYVDELHEIKKNNAYNNIASNDKKQAVLNLTINDVNNVITKLKQDGYFKEALIIEFLMEFPCRLEVSNLKYIKLDEYTKLKRKNNLGEDNYVVVGSKKAYVSRGSYKTSDTYGRIEMELKPPLKSKILNYIKDNNININESIFGYNPQDLAKRLHYITGKMNNGVSISTNIICKVANTNNILNAVGGDTEIFDKIEKVNNAMEETGKIRGTSKKTIESNYTLRNK